MGGKKLQGMQGPGLTSNDIHPLVTQKRGGVPKIKISCSEREGKLGFAGGFASAVFATALEKGREKVVRSNSPSAPPTKGEEGT